VTLAVLGVLLVVLVAALSYRHAQRRRAREAIEDSNWQWERVRRRVDELLDGRWDSTLVLITRYQVSSESAGQLLRQRLSERSSDRVEVVWEEAPHKDPRWVVVTTTETTLVTPILGRQWLARMRTVCEWGACDMAHWGVLWGGSPPSPAPVGSEPG